MELVTPERKMTKAEQTRAGQVKRARRRRMVLDLRAAGLTHEAVAEQMTAMGEKITRVGVTRMLGRLLAEMAELDQADLREVRQLEIYRIDQALQVLWPKVKDGNLKAMREYRAFIDQRARLMGTYAAQKHEVQGNINHVLDVSDREEIKRLEEAFLTGHAEEITDDDLDVKMLEPGEGSD